MRGFQVTLGELTFGEEPGSTAGSNQKYPSSNFAQPNPQSVKFSRSNKVKVNEIPYPEDKTIRASHQTLYTCNLKVHTLNEDPFNRLLDMCQDTGPWLLHTGDRPSPIFMYIIEYSYDKVEGHEDNYKEWDLTLQEVND